MIFFPLFSPFQILLPTSDPCRKRAYGLAELAKLRQPLIVPVDITRAIVADHLRDDLRNLVGGVCVCGRNAFNQFFDTPHG